MGVDVLDDGGELVVDGGVGVGAGAEPAEGGLGALEVAVLDEPAGSSRVRLDVQSVVWV